MLEKVVRYRPIMKSRLVMQHRLTMKYGLIVLLATFTLGPVAVAQEPEHRGSRLLGGLAADFDADQDGVISREEFSQGADVMFSELDKNADGVLAADELPHPRGFRHGRHGRRGPGMMGGMIISRAADDDGDGGVASQEWQAFLDSLEVEADGAITEDSLRAALPVPPRKGPAGVGGGPPAGHLSRMLDRDGDAVLTLDDLNAIFAELDQDSNGELEAEELPRFRGHRGPPTR